MKEKEICTSIFENMEIGESSDAINDLKRYANQRVIEELKELQIGLPSGIDGTLLFIRMNKRIKELKQE